MLHRSRFVQLSVVLLVLVLVISPAAAETPEGPLVAACLPGAGYAPGCDVDQDGDIDISDVQLTAGRWGATGAYTTGHTHFGETWPGTAPTTGLTVQHTAVSGFTTGLYGQSASNNGIGVRGRASATTGTTYGVFGEHFSGSGAAVYGLASAAAGANRGVMGLTNSFDGAGVYGYATANGGTNYGVYGKTESPDGFGVYGLGEGAFNSSIGVGGYSNSSDGIGVYGQANGSGNTAGVWGYTAAQDGWGVRGVNSHPFGYAGYFAGHVDVVGNLHKLGGSFKIDHPLDPANKYLYHSFVESPDMKNIYDGVVTLDQDGAAWVELPDWFEALNQDFRYQLTAMGAAMPNLHVAQKVRNNRFQVGGGQPGLEVSWQVTGIRHDVWAEQNRIPVEEEKPADEQGRYRYPRGYGRPETEMVDYLPPPVDVTAASK